MLLGASKAAAFVALAPVIAALMAIPALSEWPTSIDWLAIGMITAGVYLASGAPLPGWTARCQAEQRVCRGLRPRLRS
jgi:drug/metabolite transporter (DMT)-like permease